MEREGKAILKRNTNGLYKRKTRQTESAQPTRGGISSEEISATDRVMGVTTLQRGMQAFKPSLGTPKRSV